MKVSVIIPALDEEASIGKVLDAIPKDLVTDIIVVDNGSRDRTAEVADQHGARVVREEERGYGAACLAGLAALGETDVVVFLDGDYSDYPEDLPLLLAPIQEGRADLVIGSRVQGRSEAGALNPQQRFGNWLAVRLLKWLYGVQYTDLGPFRAIRYDALRSLGMRDRDYGWTVEMQIRAARQRLRSCEVPVRYRQRIGKSKITGTLLGSVKAASKITCLMIALHHVRRAKSEDRKNSGVD